VWHAYPRFDARLTPADIELIRPPKFYGGNRGQLRNTVVKLLKAKAPGSITTSEISVEIQVRFLLTFETPAIRTSWWQCNSIGRLMRKLYEQKLVERRHDPKALTEERGRWRWRSDVAASPDHLQRLIESTGGKVLQYSGADLEEVDAIKGECAQGLTGLADSRT
jgi:hypothetical protein